MNRTPYPFYLNGTEWLLLEPLLPPPKPGGRPIKYPRLEIVSDILYILSTGAAWRMLPHDLPPCRIVFHYYRVWQQDGAWRQVNDALCQQTRQQQRRHPEPGSANMDSPVKTTGGEPWPRCRPESDGAQGVIKRRTPRGCCWRWSCIRRMYRVGTVFPVAADLG